MQHDHPVHPEICPIPDFATFFSRFGVRWPEGAFVAYWPTISKLLVVNTEENHRTLQSILAVFDIPPKPVEIDC